MGAHITVAVILAMSALGSIVVRRLHNRRADRLAAMRYGRLQPDQEGPATEKRRTHPVRVPSLLGRVRRGNRDGSPARHLARRRH